MPARERAPGVGPGLVQGPRQTADNANATPEAGHVSDRPTPAVAAWVALIRPDLDRAAEALFSVGDNLIKAKQELKHGQFGALLGELDISPRNAQRMMVVSRNAVLRDATRVSHLPSAWSVLHELARVPDEELAEAIENGSVTPETTRAEAAALRAGSAGDPPMTEGEAERLAQLEAAMGEALISMLSGLEHAGGFAQLRLLDELLRRVDGADEADLLIMELLASMTIDALDRRGPIKEGDNPLGRLSASIATTLRHLWRSEHETARDALVEVSKEAATISGEVRPHLMLHVLDGRTAEQVHPVTRLIVDAVLVGLLPEGQPA